MVFSLQLARPLLLTHTYTHIDMGFLCGNQCSWSVFGSALNWTEAWFLLLVYISPLSIYIHNFLSTAGIWRSELWVFAHPKLLRSLWNFSLSAYLFFSLYGSCRTDNNGWIGDDFVVTSLKKKKMLLTISPDKFLVCSAAPNFVFYLFIFLIYLLFYGFLNMNCEAVCFFHTGKSFSFPEGIPCSHYSACFCLLFFN